VKKKKRIIKYKLQAWILSLYGAGSICGEVCEQVSTWVHLHHHHKRFWAIALSQEKKISQRLHLFKFFEIDDALSYM